MTRSFILTLSQFRIIPNAGGEIAEIRVDLVESHTEVKRTIDVSSDLTAAAGLFGGSARFVFAEGSAFQEIHFGLSFTQGYDSSNLTLCQIVEGAL